MTIHAICIADVARWFHNDVIASDKEGWNVFNSGDGDARLERDDEAERFDSDSDVWEYVAMRAAKGSGRHQRALLHVALLNPKEWKQITKHLDGVADLGEAPLPKPRRMD